MNVRCNQCGKQASKMGHTKVALWCEDVMRWDWTRRNGRMLFFVTKKTDTSRESNVKIINCSSVIFFFFDCLMRLDRSINREKVKLFLDKKIHEDHKIVCKNADSDNDDGDGDGCRKGRRQHRRRTSDSLQEAAAAEAAKAAQTTSAAPLTNLSQHDRAAPERLLPRSHPSHYHPPVYERTN